MIENDVINRIHELLSFNHWSLYKLAKKSGIPYSSINNIFLRNTCPTIPTLEKICCGFGISLSEFFDYSQNPLRNSELTKEEQDILNTYQSLSIKDKGLITAYLNGLSKKPM